MSDDDAQEELRLKFAQYRVSPAVIDDLKRAPEVPGGERPPAVAGARSLGGHEIDPNARARVIIELNADYPEGVIAARDRVHEMILNWGAEHEPKERSRHYVFASLNMSELKILCGLPHSSPVFKVWRDEPLKPLLTRSVRTVKADACLTTYGADGAGIVVAVADSGIDGTHRHFVKHANLDPPSGLQHQDFTTGGTPQSALTDEFGHGTHVAGIVAGLTDTDDTPARRIRELRDATGTVVTGTDPIPDKTILRGVAPKAKLLSLKVLDAGGRGYASSLIAALEYLEQVNDSGRKIKVHCVNLSLGYPFDASWFAAGHSPLCAVVNRISRAGLVVVAAAGNDGSTLLATEGRTDKQRVGVDQSINDPGNAEEAITVGATHAEAPHTYGVSWFSSRGPTADGRVKPDLVAPGERILSCAASGSKKTNEGLREAGEVAAAGVSYFREESGTSMAAPHVAGAVAALLSVRGEYVGRPDLVKRILVDNCVDLGRKKDFQGAGLLDLMKAFQSV